MKNEAPICEAHGDNEAEYQCEKCLKQLCMQCVSQEAHLFFCSFCGGSARRIIVTPGPTAVKEVIASSPDILKQVAAAVTNHIIVPAAIIVMVSAFLFFLLDVRSVYLGGTSQLKRVGFFFAAAAVLIARYGKVHAIKKRQNIYTAILALATLRAMMVFSGGIKATLVNMVVIFIVWRFATRVANSLDIEEDEGPVTKKYECRFYGVERLKHEEIERRLELNPDRYIPGKIGEKKKKKKRFFGGWLQGADAHGNPAGSVARLAMLAVFVFALGESIILAGAPEVGKRALTAVIVFLFSTGIVLAAASSTGTYRHTRKLGGKASMGMVPIKIAIAALLSVLILAVGLTVPGIRYEGSGVVQPKKFIGPGGSIKGKEEGRGQSVDREGRQSRQDKDSSTGKEGEESQDHDPGDQSGSRAGSGSLMDVFTAIGKLLLIPLVLVFIVLVIYGLVKLWPALKDWRPGLMDRIRRLLKKLKSLLKSRRSGGDTGAPVRINPLAMLSGIETLPPREAILKAYHCLLAFFDQMGHERQKRLTPYEFLYSLPERLKYLSEPAGKLTDLYVNTAYSHKSPTPEDSKEALAALYRLRHLIGERRSR
jgi:hypothetical protein